ncbi:MAG: hypothetical protein JJT78_01425 [Leptospira sp.]|nr:hypothetical protein [Leptospira sp.]
MKKAIIATIVAGFLSTGLVAQTHTIFVHGKSGKNHNGTSKTDVNNYWGSDKNTVSGSKYFVGYNGKTDPRTYGSARAQTNLTTVLTQRCRGSQTCKIVCHSAGCYATEFWLANLGGTAASKGFNITKVTALASASGGSELASALNGITFGFGGNAMDKALRVGTARPAYNHNNTAGVSVFQVPGYKSFFGPNIILPGRDDYAVAYHSSCAYNRSGGLDKCQNSLTKKEGIWPFRKKVTYKMFSGHHRAPSVSVGGLNRNHGQLKADGWR